MPSPYSATFLISIERTITKERLTRYLNACGHDLSKALDLYEYNVQLSEALYGLLHGLEVTVRNAEHHALTTSYGTPAWYDLAPLSAYWQDKIADAKAKPGTAGKPGKIVAELSFGFWVELLQNKHHRRFWVDRKLNAAFPYARRHRSLIHDRLKAIQLLRNRISHHEPVLTSGNVLYNGDGVLNLSEILECIAWVCPETAQWIKAHFRYGEVERILRVVAAMKVTL